jgi:hypothetical protein
MAGPRPEEKPHRSCDRELDWQVWMVLQIAYNWLYSKFHVKVLLKAG